LALAILLGHALFLQLLFTARQPPSPGEHLVPPLAWLQLKPEAALSLSTPVESASARVQPVPILTVPPDIAHRLPALSPSQGPMAEALEVYVSCGLPDDNRLWTEDQRRCAQRLWDLYKTLPPRELSAQEKELARKFERDLKIQNAPMLLPCFGPAGGVIPACVIQGLLQGFEANAGYAETDMRDTHVHGMPRAPRLPGMRSGLP
jgi:hypothetical protein